MLQLSNYTEQRARDLQRLLNEIHEAGIIHLDPYPRNILIQGESNRVLWIDYELAQIFDPEHSDHPGFFAQEKDFMDAFVEAPVILPVPVLFQISD
jgi:serine/threonine protein kinase